MCRRRKRRSGNSSSIGTTTADPRRRLLLLLLFDADLAAGVAVDGNNNDCVPEKQQQQLSFESDPTLCASAAAQAQKEKEREKERNQSKRRTFSARVISCREGKNCSGSLPEEARAYSERVASSPFLPSPILIPRVESDQPEMEWRSRLLGASASLKRSGNSSLTLWGPRVNQPHTFLFMRGRVEKELRARVFREFSFSPGFLNHPIWFPFPFKSLRISVLSVPPLRAQPSLMSIRGLCSPAASTQSIRPAHVRTVVCVDFLSLIGRLILVCVCSNCACSQGPLHRLSMLYS